ncbi:sulfotransferase [Crocinitomicaceae bacterium]|nr:sulfotransferase [Crocinitomicaceae bacterium]
MANVPKLLKKAVTLLQAGDYTAAEKLFHKILKIAPGHIDARHLLGLSHLRRSSHAQAIGLFREVIAANPRQPECHYHLGYSLFRTQQLDLAAQHFGEAFRLNPNLAEAYSYLALVLTESGAMQQALLMAKKALDINPRHPEIQTNQAIVFEKWGDQASALKHYTAAKEMQPSNPVYHVNVGHALTGQGEISAAKLCYQEAIKLAYAYGEPYLGLTRIGGITAEDTELIDRLQNLCESRSTPSKDKIPMLYTLGIISEKAGKHKEAFGYYARANVLDDKNSQFSIENFKNHAALITSILNKAFIQKHNYRHQSDITPVFIVGMPRSGTSLVHQILASHPAVYGAGELNWFPFIQQNLKRLLRTEQNFPECSDLLDEENAATIANDYLAHMQSLANGEKVIIDKMPVNFLYLGLIVILFPHAKIIHCTREPRDTCLSIYFNRFVGSIHYASNLSSLGAYYRIYQQVMHHWEQVLPDVIHEVNYESLIESPEAISRKALEYLGLDWHPDCLSFHKSRTAMRTASDHQVRKPIYKSSISRWKNYEPYLQELEQALAGRAQG